MLPFKKISVCHGKTCGPAGAARIKQTLEQAYGDSVEIVERLCCGRCDDHNSIVIDDSVTVSHLSPENVRNDFIADPDTAIKRAREEEKKIQDQLDAALNGDLLG